VAGAVAVAYTTIGGMRAVMLTDMLQCVVILAAFVAFAALGIVTNSHGIQGVFQDAARLGNLKPFIPFDPRFFSFDPTIRITFWSGLIGVFFAFLARYGADQVVTQRFSSARSVDAARRGYWLSAGVAVTVIALLGMAGLIAKSYAFQAGLLDKGMPPLKIIAMMASDMPAGMAGLLAAAILAATMSSMDSGVNAVSAVWFSSISSAPGACTPRSVREVSLVCGALVIGLALAFVFFLGPHQPIFELVNKIVNGMATPLLALFAVALVWPSIGSRAIRVGGAAGIVLSLVLTVFVNNLALHYYAVMNFAVTALCCLVAGMAGGKRKE
jgi:Na+/proline symporter